jgi:hypothetical protein
MSITFIHNRLSITILLYIIILCAWGLWRYARKEQVNANYRGALAIAEALIIVQGSLGLFLSLISLQPERGGIHILYGVLGTLGIPAVYIFTKGRNDRKSILVYSAVLFFNVGIFIRSIVTG